MNLKPQKQIAAKILKCGLSRVRIEAKKEVSDALTREDIRGLIRKGLIKKIQVKGQSRVGARRILAQKKAGRRQGPGSRKGAKGAITPSKREWINRVRPIRVLLRKFRDSKQLKREDYSKLLLMVKGGAFRNKKHLVFYLREHELIKEWKK